MNIYFAAPIKDGRVHQPEFKAIIAALQKYGSVHAPHAKGDAFSHYGETGISDSEIFNREIAALHEVDLMVAEITTGAHGVGYLVAQAIAFNKKVIALYRGESALKISSIFKGDPRVHIYLYKDETEIESVIARALTSGGDAPQ